MHHLGIVPKSQSIKCEHANMGTHLILDAGHISIESELANKKAVQEINAKRKQQYSEEDYRRLEALMYDKLTVKLESTQVSLNMLFDILFL